MCVCEGYVHMSVVPTEARGADSSGAGGTGHCESTNGGAEN